MDASAQKPKCNEATLRRLAEMRKRAAEVRKQKAELRQAEKDEKKQAFQRAYEDKVLKKKRVPAANQAEAKTSDDESLTDLEIHPRAALGPVMEEEDPAIERKNKVGGAARRTKVSAVHTEPSAKERYYEYKLNRLQNEQEQKTFVNQYAQLPPYAHMQDIARNQIRATVDKQVLERVYGELFGCQ